MDAKMKDKTIIFCLVGNSGCGKTMAAEYLSKCTNLPLVCSYTTRPMRDGETNGREHYFVGVEEMPRRREMLAYTFFGGYHYWATKEQAKSDCIYVIDEEGVRSLVTEFGDDYVILPIHITRESVDVDIARQARDIARKPLGYNAFIAQVKNDGTKEDFLYEITEQVNLCLHNDYWVRTWYKHHKQYLL